MAEIDLLNILAVNIHDHILNASDKNQSFNLTLDVDYIHGHEYIDNKLHYWIVVLSEPGVCYCSDAEIDPSIVRQYTKDIKRKKPLPRRLTGRGRQPKLFFSPYDPKFGAKSKKSVQQSVKQKAKHARK